MYFFSDIVLNFIKNIYFFVFELGRKINYVNIF